METISGKKKMWIITVVLTGIRLTWGKSSSGRWKFLTLNAGYLPIKNSFWALVEIRENSHLLWNIKSEFQCTCRSKVPGIHVNEEMNAMIPMNRVYILLEFSCHLVTLSENIEYKSIIYTAQLYKRVWVICITTLRKGGNLRIFLPAPEVFIPIWRL
jgi:hypothetical protein